MNLLFNSVTDAIHTERMLVFVVKREQTVVVKQDLIAGEQIHVD